MCDFDTFEYILYFSGYIFDFESNVHHPPLDIELGRYNTYIAKSRSIKQEHKRKIYAEYCYIIFIFATMFWILPYTCYMAIRDKNIDHFGRSLFQLIVVSQYYNGIKYFNHTHFYENIVSNSNIMYYMKILLPSVSIASLILTIFNVILLGSDVYIHGYSDIYTNSNTIEKILLLILYFFDSIYSYLTFTLNACVFVINMVNHKNTVSDYSHSLINYIKNSMDTIQKLNIIAIEFSQMKDKFDQTVIYLTPFFTTFNFIGFIMIYFYLRTIRDGTITPAEIINMILFGIVEVIYIVAIQTVNNNIINIADTISSNSVITTFFGNKRFNRIISPLDEVTDDIVDNKKNNMNDLENSSKFKDMNDNDINKKITILDNHIVKIHSMVTHNLIASISADQMMDWLVLQGIVSGKWQTFRIFGIELTDSKLISRIFGIFATVLISSEIGTLLSWW